jgi:hypothetical protein
MIDRIRTAEVQIQFALYKGVDKKILPAIDFVAPEL